MRCEEVEELAGAYALNAVPPKEAEDVRRHLLGCEKHAEVADLVLTAERLAVLAPAMEPPAELKARLMDAVRADLAREKGTSRAARPSFDPLRWLKRLFSSPRLGYAFASAMAALVAVLIIANLSGGGEGDTLIRDFQSGPVAGKVVYIPEDKTAVVTVDGLQPAPPGKTYQVWAITGDQPASIGFLTVPDEGTAAAAMNVELTEGQTVALTLEPTGGSTQPTTTPIFGVKI